MRGTQKNPERSELRAGPLGINAPPAMQSHGNGREANDENKREQDQESCPSAQPGELFEKLFHDSQRKKAEPPPTRDVNRTSETECAIRHLLQ